MNRIADKVKLMQLQIATRLQQGLTTPEAVATIDVKLNMAMDEYCIFQEVKTLAVAHGVLSQEEGMTIYGYLGESLDTYNNQPIHVKYVLSKLATELLQWKLRLRGIGVSGKVPGLATMNRMARVNPQTRKPVGTSKVATAPKPPPPMMPKQ